MLTNVYVRTEKYKAHIFQYSPTEMKTVFKNQLKIG